MKKRVVGSSRRFRDCAGSGCGKIVVIGNNKAVEGEAGKDAFAAPFCRSFRCGGSGCGLRLSFCLGCGGLQSIFRVFSLCSGGLPICGNNECDFLGLISHGGKDLFDRAAQTLLSPIAGEPVGHADGIDPILAGEQFRISQQGTECLPVHASLHLGHGGFPGILSGSCRAVENMRLWVLVSSNHCLFSHILLNFRCGRKTLLSAAFRAVWKLNAVSFSG